jgi:hypothetical protein
MQTMHSAFGGINKRRYGETQPSSVHDASHMLLRTFMSWGMGTLRLGGGVTF